MRKPGEETAEGRTPRVVVLLSGASDRDRATEEGLRQARLGVRLCRDPDAALTAARRPDTRLLLIDAEHPGLAAERFLASLREGGSAPPVIALLGEGQSPAEVLGPGWGTECFLSRPIGAATLATLCRAFVAPGTETVDTRPREGATPPVRVRRPTRFSTRPMYARTVGYVRETLDAVARGEALNLAPLATLAERTHTALLQSNLLFLQALEPYARFDLAHHCVNVATIAGKVAIALGLSLGETLRVIQAGLIHDLGMMRIPERILHKEGPLSSAEREEMQRHPVYGAEILEAFGEEWSWLRTAVRQEHERHRGQGYPEGLAGGEIDGIARVLGVADVFEALTQVRSFRSPFTLYDALEKVSAMRGDYFAAELVDALASEISVFPIDSYVQLSTGEIGRVVAANSQNLMRPTLEVLWDADWNPLGEARRVDLAERGELSIVRPLHEAEVPIT
ncbi:MAG: HD-GYP domain-containing protein [Gemmatimonadota bacterium]